MADDLCDRCGVRPAVAVVQEVLGDQAPTTLRLCPVCVSENRGATEEMRRSGLFDEFFDTFFGDDDDDGPTPAADGGEPAHVDLTRLLCQATRRVLHDAGRRAMDRGSIDLEPEDLLGAALGDEVVRRVLQDVEVDPEALDRQLRQVVERYQPTGIPPALSPDAKYALLAAFQSSRRHGSSYIGPEHLLLALADDDETRASELLSRAGADPDAIEAALADHPAAGPPPGEATTTPTLDRFGRDLTALARDGALDPVVGRSEQIELTIEVLSRRTKNNPVLVGEAGVGKTAVVEGIAQRIVEGDVPETLAGRRVIGLDVGGLLAGTRFRGDFEQRIQQLVDEIRANEATVLVFIDEIHTIVGAGGGEGSVDAGNLLKPALSRGELHVIGATTLDEYRRSIERDPALARRFQPVVVPEPSVPDTVRILCGLKDRYEAFHRVRISDEALDAAATLSHRYVADRFLPDKAIDLLDQAAARVRLRTATPSSEGRAHRERLAALQRDKDQAVAAEDYERAAELRRRMAELAGADGAEPAPRRRGVVTADDVADVVARGTGIPVSQLTLEERDRLLQLEEHLQQRVVGQEPAVRAVAEAVRRSRAGLGDPDRPLGSFLFLGPTGVGKTELARALAQALFGDEGSLIRLDMSEFQERHTVSRLVGSPPGYVGYEEAGQLTERIRRRPYSVLLFDEIDKAHPDVAGLLLQVLDDGRLTDAQGRMVDCRNTVVILTSNVGAERLHGAAQRVGFQRPGEGPAAPPDPLRGDLGADLRRQFRPELLNRIDEIVVFGPLEPRHLRRIVQRLVDASSRRLAARSIGLVVDDDALDHLAAAGFDPEFGARPLRRAVQREVEGELSRLVLAGGAAAGDVVAVGVVDGRLRFDVERGAYRPPPLPTWSAPAAAPARRPAPSLG